MRIKRIQKIKTPSANPDIDLSLIKDIIIDYQQNPSNLIVLLQKVQTIYGYLPEKVLLYIQEQIQISVSEQYAVATFYTQFKLQPVGKYIIKVCKGTACHVQNSENIAQSISNYLKINAGETTSDGKYSLEIVSCLGCCSLAPAMMIDEKTYGNLNEQTAIQYIANLE